MAQLQARRQVRTQIQLTSEQSRLLKEMAAETGASVAELIRNGVETVLAKRRGPDKEAIRQRAIAALGKFHSGVSDLSTNLDAYFAEAIEASKKDNE